MVAFWPQLLAARILLTGWTRGDRIHGIEPIVEWEDLTEKLATTDLALPLEEGMEIFTRFEAELIEDAPLEQSFSWL